MCAGFVDNFQAEQIRVEGRLDSVVDDPTTGRQHFWLDRYHARILATLKDRVWRSAELLELCRAAFIRLNETLFPAGPQPQGIHVLLNIFRQNKSHSRVAVSETCDWSQRCNGVYA